MQTIAKSTTPFERRFESGKEARGLLFFDIDREEIFEARRIDQEPAAR